MELRLYWKIFSRRWWLIVVPVLVVTGHLIATYRPPTPVYQVTMRFAAGTRPAGLSEDYDRYYVWLASEYVANGLADIARGDRFASAVAARLAGSGLEVSPAHIRSAIVTDNAQSILVIYFNWPDAAQSVAIAEAITAELTTNSAAYFPQLEGLQPAVRPVDVPTPVLMPPGLRSRLLEPAVRLGLACAMGMALALLWHYLDPTVREVREIEELGIAVIAEIPRHRRLTSGRG